MPGLLMYADPQQAKPIGECARCGGEIYSREEGGTCFACRRRLARWDRRTAQAVLEDMDGQLQKYLSDDLRDAVWNAMAPKYLADEE